MNTGLKTSEPHLLLPSIRFASVHSVQSVVKTDRSKPFYRVVIEATPPAGDQAAWKIQYGFNNQPGRPEEATIVSDTEGLLTFTVPVVQAKPPGIKATLRVITRFWNQWQ